MMFAFPRGLSIPSPPCHMQLEWLQMYQPSNPEGTSSSPRRLTPERRWLLPSSAC